MRLFIAVWATSFIILFFTAAVVDTKNRDTGYLILGTGFFTCIFALAVWGWVG